MVSLEYLYMHAVSRKRLVCIVASALLLHHRMLQTPRPGKESGRKQSRRLGAADAPSCDTGAASAAFAALTRVSVHRPGQGGSAPQGQLNVVCELSCALFV